MNDKQFVLQFVVTVALCAAIIAVLASFHRELQPIRRALTSCSYMSPGPAELAVDANGNLWR